MVWANSAPNRVQLLLYLVFSLLKATTLIRHLWDCDDRDVTALRFVGYPVWTLLLTPQRISCDRKNTARRTRSSFVERVSNQ
jgi:hypothetical protein